MARKHGAPTARKVTHELEWLRLTVRPHRTERGAAPRTQGSRRSLTEQVLGVPLAALEDYAVRTAYRHGHEILSSQRSKAPARSPRGRAKRLTPAEVRLENARALLAHLIEVATSPKCGEVFLLHREARLSPARIATRLGLTVAAVERYLDRAFCVFAQILREARTEASSKR